MPPPYKPTSYTTYTQVPKSENHHGSILRRSLNFLDVLGDIILCLTPLSFIILAGCAYSLDGKALSKFGRNIQAWSLLSPTIFPLAFAAVVGRAMTFFARYRLERGSSLGVLEQLIGSQTVFGAIWLQVVLRNFNALGVFLVLLWLVSPLGGQASLRLISQDQKVTEGSATLALVNISGQPSSFQQAFAQSLTGAPINALYIGSLVAPLDIKTGAQDTWGNIKIPRFETYNQTLDDEGFATVPEEDVDWISLLGLPVAGLDPSRDTNFTMTTWYHNMECSDMHKVPASSDWVRGISADDSEANASTIWATAGDYSSWLLWQVKDLRPGSDDSSRLNFIWLSKSGLINNVDSTTALNYNETCLANCTLTYTYVEAQVECRGLNCKATKIRKGVRPPTTIWSEGLLTISSSIWSYYSENLVETDTRAADRTSSVTEQYIYGHVESPFQYGVTAASAVLSYLDMTEIPLADFTRRLRTILNTYFIASLAPQASTGTMSSANAARLLSGEDKIQGGFYGLYLMPAAATTASSTDIYHCNKTFFGLAIVSSSILFITGVAGVVAKYWCRGPDMLGYVTSIVRHNPHTPLHPQNTTLDTSELARRSKKMFVRLEDVRDETENTMGHIAISSLRKTSIRQARVLDPRRKYV